MTKFYFVMVLLCISIIGITVFTLPSFAQFEANVSVNTDKLSYVDGDTIIISGNVEDILSETPLLIQIFDPLSNRIEIVTKDVAQDGSFIHTIKADGPLWQEAGEYTVKISYGPTDTVEVIFSFDPEEAMSETKKIFEVDAGSYGTFDVQYTIEWGTLEDMIIDVEHFALIVSINSIADGIVTLDIPRDLIAVTNANRNDVSFIILIDGVEVSYQETTTSTSRTLTIQFAEGDSEIQIIGTLGDGSIPTPEPETEPVLLEVTVDQELYAPGNTIVVTITIKDPEVGVKGTLRILDVNENLIGIDQFLPDSTGIYSKEFVADGPLWKEPGTYQVIVSYGGQKMETTFQFTGSSGVVTPPPPPPEPSGQTILVRGTDFFVDYSITGGQLQGIVIDKGRPSLIISIDATEDGKLTIILPQGLIRAYGSDFSVFRDGEEIDFDVTETSTDSILTISFHAGTEEIEIITSQPTTPAASVIFVFTDKRSYDAGETIVVSGEVRELISQTPLTIAVISPNGSQVTAQQVNVSSDKSFITRITDTEDIMIVSGTYTVAATYGHAERNYAKTTFEFTTGEVSIPEPEEKTILCHNGTNTIEVATESVRTHLDHGDSFGKCPSEQPKPSPIPHGTDVIIPEGSGVPGCEEFNGCFFPATIRADVGGTITWLNADTAAHTVTSGNPSDGPDGIFDSSLFMPGQSFSHTFRTSGTYDYFCMVHPWMQGIAVIGHGGPGPSVPTPGPEHKVDLDIFVNERVFDLGDLVTMEIEMKGITKSQNVAIGVSNPTGTTVVSRTVTVEPNSLAQIEFRISEDFKTGHYKVIATSSVEGKTIKESTHFKVKSQFNQFKIVTVEATNQQGHPSTFEKGTIGFIKVILNSNKNIATLVTVNLFDSEVTTIGIGSVKTTLSSGQSEIILSFMIPEDAAIGPADIFVNAFSDWPSNGGIPQTGEVAVQEEIL